MSSTPPEKVQIDSARAQAAAKELRLARTKGMTFAVMEVDTHPWGTVQLVRHGAYGEKGLRFEIIVQANHVDDQVFVGNRDVILAALSAMESPLEKALAANGDALRFIAGFDSATAARIQASDIAPPSPPEPEGGPPLPGKGSLRLFTTK